MKEPTYILAVLIGALIGLAVTVPIVLLNHIRNDAMEYQRQSLEIASTTRAIESEERDTLNVLACHELNAAQADFINCVNSQ